MIFFFYIEDRSEVTTAITDPVGWDATENIIDRDGDHHGAVFIYQGNEYEYSGIAAKLLRGEYNTYGAEGKMFLVSKYKCVITDTEEIEWFRGRFDFSQWDNSVGEDCNVKLDVTETSDIVSFNNRIDQKVNLETLVSFDGSDLDVYPKLGFTATLPGKGIFAEDYSINKDDISEPFFGDWTAAGGGTDKGLTQQAYFVPAYDTEVSSEIGGYSTGTGVDSSYDVAILYTAPPGIDLPYTLLDGIYGTSTVDLDLINPVVNYDRTLGNTFGDTIFNDLTLNIEIPFTSINTHLVDGLPVTDGICYWSYYACIRRLDASTTIAPGGVDWLSTDPDVWGVHRTFPITPSPLFETTTKSIEITGLTLYPGDRIYFFYVLGYRKYNSLSTETAFDITYDIDCSFRLSGLSKVADTTSKLFMVNEAFSRITEAVSDNKLKVYSEYFGRTDSKPYLTDADGCGGLECITMGQFIRRIEQKKVDTPPIFNMSFMDMWKGLNPIHNLGWGFEIDPERSIGFNWVRIEPYKYFYQDEIIFSCLNIPTIRTKARPSDHVSTFKYGFEKWEAEDFNGIDEFLTKREARTTLTQIIQTFEKISTMIGSGYALEVTRRKGNETSEDFKYDNDCFIICMKRDGPNIAVEQGGIDSPENIIDPDTIYNWRIRPLYNAMRWAPLVFQSYRDYSDTSKIIFTNGDGNVYAKGGITSSGCHISDEILSEKDTITPALFTDPTYPRPLWYPEDKTFSFPLTVADFKILKANPYKLIHFENEFEAGDGWIRKIVHKPEQGTADFTLMPKIVYE